MFTTANGSRANEIWIGWSKTWQLHKWNNICVEFYTGQQGFYSIRRLDIKEKRKSQHFWIYYKRETVQKLIVQHIPVMKRFPRFKHFVTFIARLLPNSGNKLDFKLRKNLFVFKEPAREENIGRVNEYRQKCHWEAQLSFFPTFYLNLCSRSCSNNRQRICRWIELKVPGG